MEYFIFKGEKNPPDLRCKQLEVVPGVRQEQSSKIWDIIEEIASMTSGRSLAINWNQYFMTVKYGKNTATLKIPLIHVLGFFCHCGTDH